MVWTNIKDGEKGGNLARVTNGALWVTSGEGIFQMNELAALGITPDTPSRIIMQTADRSNGAGLGNSFWGNSGAGDQPVLIAAAAMEFVSASANDTLAGTGAQKLYIEGIDGNGALQSNTFDTNGTSAVAIGNWLEINIAEVTQVGSSGANAGAITIRAVTGPVTQAVITAANRGVLNQHRYRVPAGRVAFPKFVLFGSMGTGVDSAQLVGTHYTYRYHDAQSGPGPGVLIRYEVGRVCAFRGHPIPIDLGYSLPLRAGSVYSPDVSNGTGFTVEFTGLVLFEEFIL